MCRCEAAQRVSRSRCKSIVGGRDRGRGGDGGLGNGAMWDGVEAGADATGEGESLGTAAVG